MRRYQNYIKTKHWHWNYWVLIFKFISPRKELVFGLLQILGHRVKGLMSICEKECKHQGDWNYRRGLFVSS